MPRIRVMALELVSFGHDKFYRVFTDDTSGSWRNQYGPRGALGTLTATKHVPSAWEQVSAKEAKGYLRVGSELTIDTGRELRSCTVEELEGAYQVALRQAAEPALARLDAAVTATQSGPADARVLRLRWWEPRRRGVGGNRLVRPWGPALARALDGQPTAADPSAPGAALVVAPTLVAAWIGGHYDPGQATDLGPAGPDDTSEVLTTALTVASGGGPALPEALAVARDVLGAAPAV